MRKQKSRRLFPELDTGGEKSSKYLGNWWGRYLKKVGVKERGIDAHSFRHTAVKVWLNAEVDERWAAAICGQGYKSDEKKEKAVTYSIYGRLPAPGVLKPFVEMLDFNLDHPAFRQPKSG